MDQTVSAHCLIKHSPQLPNDQVKFATYTRDSATGNDYADQRYYTSVLGRFVTPDPYVASAGPGDPGSWNRYTYTRGDPVNRFDPFGLDDSPPCTECVIFNPYPPAAGSTSPDWGGGTGGGGGSSGNLTQTEKGAKQPYPPSFLSNPNAVAAAVRITEQRIAKAVNAALAALMNPHCAALFNLDPNAPTPAALLALIANGNDPQAYFTEEYIPQASPNTMTNAITGRTPWSMQNGTVTYVGYAQNQVVVAFNFDPSAPFNSGSVTYDATTVLHELGHVYEALYGLGSTLLVNDAGSTAASAYNDKLVEANCFPGGH